MCGFAAFVHPKSSQAEQSRRLAAMLHSMLHRGPDDAGTFFAPTQHVALGHQRLAIIDPEHGKQPMHSADGELVVVFNGAIYNYLELRRELIAKGHEIHSYSDTEVLLYAYREWGEACVERFLGMFAFVIWDKANNRLFCARDRIGIKPFYYYFDGTSLIMASEIKALFASGLVVAEANPEGLIDYNTFQFCLGDKTMFAGIKKLDPGCSMRVQLGAAAPTLSIQRYWDVDYTLDESHDEAWFTNHLAVLIEDAVRLHLRSDVPLGAHLSGGLDSSTIVCMAANLLKGETIKTFTGAFPEGPQFDETAHAKTVAAFAGTQYHEVFIQGSELDVLLPKLMHVMDEPVAGPGMIPQYVVSQLAAQHVKVVLGGQGGDEIFIGYARYLVAYLEKCLNGAIHETATSKYAVTLDSIVPNLSLLSTYRPMLQHLWSDGLFAPDAERYFKLIDRSEGMKSLYNPQALASEYSPFVEFQKFFNREGIRSLVNKMTYFDLKASLPALLHIEDRTSMAASIESRVPLLDHRIVEFMAKIPPNIKFAGGRMKHVFKQAVQQHVPPEIFARKDKMGFPTPLTQWTRGAAKDFVHDTLLSGKARQRGLFNMAEIETQIAREGEFGRVVWGLLCTELWHQQFIDQADVISKRWAA